MFSFIEFFFFPHFGCVLVVISIYHAPVSFPVNDLTVFKGCIQALRSSQFFVLSTRHICLMHFINMFNEHLILMQLMSNKG